LAGDVQSESRPRPVSRLLSLKGSLGHDGGERFQADFAPDQKTQRNGDIEPVQEYRSADSVSINLAVV
jgi:hypothetical protein